MAARDSAHLCLRKPILEIWIDADACPNPVKEVIFRAALRTGVKVWLVANKGIKLPKQPNVFLLIAPKTPDAADFMIVEKLKEGDLVVTADVPLAAQVVEKNSFALNPRGEFYNRETIHEKLATRNLMQSLRDSGTIQGGGPPSYTDREKQSFANALDRFLAKQVNLG